MPIYEYRCGACGHYLEALQKMSEAPLRKCPECGKARLKRLVSASQFRLKGSGWYETDFKDKNEKKRNLLEHAGGEPAASDTAAEPAAKDEAAKAVAAAKSDSDTAAKPKPAAKPAAAARRKAATKPRAKAARG
jgi:putative FmdB family regulatory protein